MKVVQNVPNLGLETTISLPATPVLTTADAKKIMRIDFTTDDTLVDSLISAATLWVQKKINRALISQTVIAEWDSVGNNVPLPYIGKESITAVSEVLTIDDEATETALVLNTGYFVRNGKLKVGTNLGLRATYTAGYGTASTDIPQPLIEAVGRVALNLYDRRDDEMTGEEAQGLELLQFGTMALLNPYIRY